MNKQRTNQSDIERVKRTLKLRVLQKSAVQNLDFDRAVKLKKMIKKDQKENKKLPKIDLESLTEKLENVIISFEQNNENFQYFKITIKNS